jgi:predicted nucleotidyltransferase
MNALEKESSIRDAILDMVAYFAVFGVPVSFERLNALLSVKASHLAVQSIAQGMVRSGELVKIEDEYGLAGVEYRGIEMKAMRREELMRKARRVGRMIGLLSFIKAVCVINSVAIGNPHEDSDIDLLIVTTPGRVFVAKGLLWKMFHWLRIIETEDRKAGQFSLGMFLTTRGVVFERDIMQQNEPDLVYRLMTVEPVYGARHWYEVLKASPYIKAAVPNYLWPKGARNIDRAGMKWLDKLDDKGYKIHLRHTSQQKKNLRPAAFVRVRPDIINLHALDQTRRIAETWRKLRDKSPD